jgi:ferredoxin, 2Fe-2S
VANITFIEPDGRKHILDVEPGLTIMEGARNAGVRGILADCGGSCACGTCRIYIDGEWRDTVGAANDEEAATIEAYEDAAQGTRLSCQVKVTAELDGLIVRMPEKQF